MADACPIDELQRRLANLANSLTIADLTPWMPAIAALGLSDQRRRFQTGTAPDGTTWPGLAFGRPNGGNKPLRDYGALAASVQAKTRKNELIVGTNLAYAGVHQWGATITPTRGKFLAIPLTIEAKRNGGPRFPRPFPRRLYFAIRPGGNSGAMYERTPNGRVFHYALVRSVTIPARPFLGFSREFLGEIGKLYEEIIHDKIMATIGA